MATRFLTALDYSDWHTSTILRKHAKKRPLGELETRYQYTPPQPVLSCRTVDIDVSGTRTYRPRSTADIIAEQQKLIHSLFKSGRSVTSAPARRSPRKCLGQVNDSDMQSRAKIHVQGRPLTSSSQTSDPSRQKVGPSNKRPKTTGRLKNVKPATESFMVLTVDKDMMETRRSHTELTNQIHAHWRPDSSNLNQGHFMRGQKRPDDVPPTLDAWLTFGGAAGEESSGVVDAFANFHSPEDYYNIEGSVGSRVAKQLQKGDKIRIGINGEVLSHDLKVKKWVKGEQTPTPRAESEATDGQEEDGRTEEKGERTPECITEKPPPTPQNEDDLFGDVMFESLHNIMEERDEDVEKREVKTPQTPIDFPLSWEDQVSRPQVKVICARPTPRDNNRENLCETHPVLFNKVVRTAKPRPRLASSSLAATHNSNNELNAVGGYRIKQRTLGITPAADNHPHRLDNHSGGKVKSLTFDHHTAEDEQRLKDMSVDDVVQMKIEKSEESSTSIPGMPASAKHRTSSSKKRTADREKGGRDGDESSADFSTEFHTPLDSEQNVHSKLKDQRHQPQRSVSSLSWSSRGGGAGERGAGGAGGAGGRPLAVPRPSSSVPLLGTRDMHLSVVSASRSPREGEARRGSGKGSRTSLQASGAKNTASGIIHRTQHLGGGGVSSINAGPIPGDTEFIQISQPIRNLTNKSSASITTTTGSGIRGAGAPNSPCPGMSSAGSTPLAPRSPPRSNTPENGLDNSVGSTRTDTPTNSVKLNLSHSQAQDQAGPAGGSCEQNANDSAGGEDTSLSSNKNNVVTSSGASGETPSVMSISIPTGNHHLEDEEEEELTAAQRRERSLRDQQIDQITNLLGDAILNSSEK